MLFPIRRGSSKPVGPVRWMRSRALMGLLPDRLWTHPRGVLPYRVLSPVPYGRGLPGFSGSTRIIVSVTVRLSNVRTAWHGVTCRSPMSDALSGCPGLAPGWTAFSVCNLFSVMCPAGSERERVTCSPAGRCPWDAVPRLWFRSPVVWLASCVHLVAGFSTRFRVNDFRIAYVSGYAKTLGVSRRIPTKTTPTGPVSVPSRRPPRTGEPTG